MKIKCIDANGAPLLTNGQEYEVAATLHSGLRLSLEEEKVRRVPPGHPTKVRYILAPFTVGLGCRSVRPGSRGAQALAPPPG